MVLKDPNFHSIIVVPFPRGYAGRSKANLYEVIMNVLQGVVKRSHDGFNTENVVFFGIKYFKLPGKLKEPLGISFSARL